MWRRAVLSIIVSVNFSANADEVKLYQCYSHLIITGHADEIDLAMDKLERALTLHNRVHHAIDKDSDAVEVIVEATGLNRQKLTEMVDPKWLQKLVSMIGLSSGKAGARFLGCTEQTLAR